MTYGMFLTSYAATLYVRVYCASSKSANYAVDGRATYIFFNLVIYVYLEPSQFFFQTVAL